ncbi:TATA box-binding protein-associated factor RNA polymerase I subunit B [Megalopta genalis]|uniref:TATA box-binding protein-associated factor RNA polymerase I subunit B n=1 Tax=Megalopta genalis TaxID=115081 RepID=UPI003FD2CC9C
MKQCKLCGGTDFYKEAGYFFCQTCQTQNEDIREEVLELRIDNSTRLRKTRIRSLKSQSSGEELGWTSWEIYNFVLIGLTNELIELGVPANLKLTVLQLWATYLGKLEVAFISRKRKCVPKLAKRYNKRDAEIIYGKVQLQRRKRKRKKTGSSTNTSMMSDYQSEGSSMRELSKNKRLLVNADYDRFLQSQASSDVEGLSTFTQSTYSVQSSSGKSSDNEGRLQFSSHAKEETRKIKKLSKHVPKNKRVNYKAKHISTQYKIGPHIITPMRLWAILYLALRIHNQPIQLGDMLRYGREGHLSYYKLDHLLPPEVSLSKSEIHFLTPNVEITHRGMRRLTASMAKFLGVWEVVCPDFLPLVNRYCQELGLPRGIQLYIERLIALTVPKMTFTKEKSHIPNYEGRAMAFIIVVLKTLFALDDITEYQISRISEKINSMAIPLGLLNEKLFSFREWQDYVEGRKTILTHSHFPTRIKYCPNTNGVDDLYIKFLEFVTSKADKKEPDVKNSKHCLSEELVQAMTKYIANLSSNDDTPKAIDIFPPSLTPLHSYLQYLLDNPLYDIPAVFRNDFFLTKVGYMTKPESLVELAMQCGIQLDIVDSRLHFIDKIVPPFEQPRMPSVDEMKELVDVENDTTHEHTERNENVSDYVYRKIACKVAVDIPKELYYNSIRSTIENCNHKSEDFTFMETLPDGRLAIPDDSDNEEEEKKANLAQSITEEVLNLENKFYSRYNLSLTTAEKEAIQNPRINDRMCYEKEKLQLMRNSRGQFVKRSVSTVDHEERGEDFFSVLNNLSFNSSVQTNAKQDNLLLKNGIDINNIDMDNMDIDNDFLKLGESFNLSQISLRLDDFVSTPKSEKKSCVNNNRHHFLRPFKDYWMYHCVFSRVKSKNFAVFEKSLPRSFRWLLNECALAVELSGEELYEEVCLIESYLAYLSKNPHSKDNRSGMDPVSKSQLNFILKKW